MTSVPITDLGRLLSEMAPILHETTVVFASLPPDAPAPMPLGAPGLIGTFQEDEGLTVILTEAAARHAGLVPAMEAAWITLQVPSSLEAVGLTAAVAAALAGAGLSANVVAAVHHDHVFLPVADGARALEVLRGLSRNARPGPL